MATIKQLRDQRKAINQQIESLRSQARSLSDQIQKAEGPIPDRSQRTGRISARLIPAGKNP